MNDLETGLHTTEWKKQRVLCHTKNCLIIWTEFHQQYFKVTFFCLANEAQNTTKAIEIYHDLTLERWMNAHLLCNNGQHNLICTASDGYQSEIPVNKEISHYTM